MLKRFGIVHKGDELSTKVSDIIIQRLQERDCIYDNENPELVITVGGDGTMLYAVHQYEKLLDSVCFLGVHTGTLGFYTDYLRSELDTLVEDIVGGRCEITNRSLIEVDIYGDDKVHTFALNEFRIQNPYITQVLRVYVDGEYLETFRGTGICFSTPSGSTALNKSLGGAVVSPNLEVIQMTEIASIGHNSYRSLGSSLILDKNQDILITMDNTSGLVLGADHFNLNINNVSRIKISSSKHFVRCVQYRPFSFISRIRRTFISG